MTAAQRRKEGAGDSGLDKTQSDEEKTAKQVRGFAKLKKSKIAKITTEVGGRCAFCLYACF